MTVKTLWQTIDKKRCFTFYFEDKTTNTLIHSDTFIKTRQTNYRKLKEDFVKFILDKMHLELAMIDAKVHTLKVNKIPLKIEINNNELPN